jgi:hypothetical protein
MAFDFFIAISVMFFFLLFKPIIFFSNIFDELNDGFVVEIVDTILNFVVVDEGVVVLQK